MKRERKLTIKIPKEVEADLRVSIVLYGGEIVSAEDCDDEKEREES